jgi:Na+/melibiose symporter-like transporter
MLAPLTTESYKTQYRTTGYGTANSFGRFGATISPYILFPIIAINPKITFLLFSFMTFMSIFTAVTIPYDATGKTLDNNKEEIELTNMLVE